MAWYNPLDWTGAAGVSVGEIFSKPEDTTPPLPGSTEVGMPEWAWTQYQKDPTLSALNQMAGAGQKIQMPGYKDYYTSAFREAGRSQADIQAQNVAASLAARGGGNLGGALTGAAQARQGASIQSLAAAANLNLQQNYQDLQKYQMQVANQQQSYDNLLNALTLRFNTVGQVMGAKTGQTQALLGYKASKEASDASSWGNMLSGLGNAALMLGLAA